MSVAAPLVLRPGDEPRLKALLRSPTVEAGLAPRARLVLLGGGGLPEAGIARGGGGWRAEGGGSAARSDRERAGRPPVSDDGAVGSATLEGPPASLGGTHWSARLLARH